MKGSGGGVGAGVGLMCLGEVLSWRAMLFKVQGSRWMLKGQTRHRSRLQ